MSTYNYLEHVTNDAKKYIVNHHIDTDELTAYQIVDKLWYTDAVTGNGKRGRYLTDQKKNCKRLCRTQLRFTKEGN